MVRTREQDREYQREYRQRKAVESHEQGDGAGETEAAVRAELATLKAAGQLQATSAAAVAMARVLDDPAAVPQHPAAAGQLRQLMAEIRAARLPEQKSSLALIRGGRTAS